MRATNLSNNVQVRSKILLNMLPIIGYIIIYYTHIIEGSISFTIPLGLGLFWAIQSLTISGFKDVFLSRPAKYWICYYLLGIFMVIIGSATANINFYISSLPYYLIPIMGFFVLRHYNMREMRLLLMLFIMVFVANLGWNYYLSIIEPAIFEESESTEISIMYNTVMNVATTSYLTVCLFGIGALVMCYLNTHKLSGKILLAVLVVPIAYYMLVINTRGTVALLFIVLLVGIIVAYFEPKKNNVKGYYVLTFIFFVVVAFGVLVPLLIWIAENTGSERMAERMNDLIDFSAKGDLNDVSDSGSFSQRMMLAQTSLRTFFRSPITMLIGIGEQSNVLGTDLHKIGIGNHSEFIDVLARHGIIGAILFWKIMKHYYFYLKSIATSRNVEKYVTMIFMVMIVFGFLNKFFNPIVELFMFMIFPIIILLLQAKINKE